MSYSISTLLTRNLYDVFGENDPARRRAAIDEIFTDDCVFYDPMGGVYRRCDEIPISADSRAGGSGQRRAGPMGRRPAWRGAGSRRY